MIVTKICPKKNILGLHTTKVNWIRRRPPEEITMSRRCRDCDIEFRFFKLWSKQGLLFSGQNTCAQPACLKPIWHNTKFCESHIVNVSLLSHTKSPFDAVAH